VVVIGGPEIGERFLAFGFDRLLFTGSTRVGRRVAQATAENLTPVTLELGGKSPAIVAKSADVARAARRVAFVKLLNARQTCIAPDHVLYRDLQEAFVRLFFAAARLYGADSRNPHYTAIGSPMPVPVPDQDERAPDHRKAVGNFSPASGNRDEPLAFEPLNLSAPEDLSGRENRMP